MKRNKFKIGGMALLTVVIAAGFSGCKSKYVKYDNIDDIDYAEPTEYAKNFDIEGYISKLPEVEYKKIDYPVKEIYTYKFNNYKMTIDIPEGFEVKEIPLEEKPKIVNSTSIEDSYDPDSGGIKHDKTGPATGNWQKDFSWVVSDNYLCLANPEFFDSSDDKYLQDDKYRCVISIVPNKSFYKGVSARDIFIYKYIEHCAKKEKFVNINNLFFLASNDTCSKRNSVNDVSILLDKNQFLVAGVHRKLSNKNNQEAINLFFSILNSVDIHKIK